MSGGDDGSEEKTLPATEHKIKEQRKKGQVAQGRDLIVASSFIVCVIYLMLAWRSMQAGFAHMFDQMALAASAEGGPRPSHWPAAVRSVWSDSAAMVAPLMLLPLLAAFIGSIIAHKGLLFAAEPLKPAYSKIDPVKGFKRIFSVRNLIEFLKSLFKSLLIIGIVGLAGWWALPAAMQTPLCGAACVGLALSKAMIPIALASIAIFALNALFDTGIQKWLFLREMRMTHTEMKRERKEMYGDPTIMMRRREMRYEGAMGEGETTGQAKLASVVPTMVVLGRNGQAVGLRYVRGETPAPAIVFIGKGAKAGLYARQAAMDGAFIATQPDLVESLTEKGRERRYIPEGQFQDVANLMSQVGAL
ncbi:EscU/YscU/HrcU family type III secretion system export apparatus switch protein [Neomegalonema sp.]|uniref:EscU/YscU/HrcU family type III secretion system export apparatus switch protein n=1 Tax=Neomegalonema sp. TaxID=2039713 RepID=UPI00261A57DE|nr:EscU/YscU/HrcU family type III secretion system export apparatus switch protein [Neomegalonema sp.]MDD2868166.1 EscU/YscU/HrcU family type III secretion system export apparatus switch protein [Neomegalonema sp.]